MNGYHIRVVRDGKETRFEMMQSGEKLRDISPIELIELIEALTAELRGAVESQQRPNVGTLEMVMQHTSSLRWL
jgi:hypothetical protein